MAKSKKLVCVGDVVMDAFIVLEKARVRDHPDREHLEICMPFADKIPYRSLTVMPAVGNASNVAVGARRLGIDTMILTAVGNDYYGHQILDWYRKEKVRTRFVKVNVGKPTNYHFVLNYGPERTILIKHEDYRYDEPARIGRADWIYFSSIGEHTLPFHEKMAKYLAAHPSTKMAFNPGTFQLKFGPKKMKNIYKKSYALFVNREEAELILGMKHNNIKNLMRGLRKLGPKVDRNYGRALRRLRIRRRFVLFYAALSRSEAADFTDRCRRCLFDRILFGPDLRSVGARSAQMGSYRIHACRAIFRRTNGASHEIPASLVFKKGTEEIPAEIYMKKAAKKRSAEIIHHFHCCDCGRWWSVGDAPVRKTVWFCPWCGAKGKYSSRAKR